MKSWALEEKKNLSDTGSPEILGDLAGVKMDLWESNEDPAKLVSQVCVGLPAVPVWHSGGHIDLIEQNYQSVKAPMLLKDIKEENMAGPTKHP